MKIASIEPVAVADVKAVDIAENRIYILLNGRLRLVKAIREGGFDTYAVYFEYFFCFVKEGATLYKLVLTEVQS